MAEQNVVGGGVLATAVAKRPRNNGLSTTASRRSRRYKDNGSPEGAGHDGASTTERLPAAEKKAMHREFSTKSGDQSWLDGCARRRRS